MDPMPSSEEAQARGTASFSAGNFTDAITHYTDALSPSNHLLYCDRSTAYASLNDFLSALSDAQKAVQLDGSWPACHARLGAAYLGLRDYSKSVSAFQDGLKIAPGNEGLKSGLTRAAAAKSFGSFSGGLPCPHQQQLSRRQRLTQYQFTKQQKQQQANMLRGQPSSGKAGDGKVKKRSKTGTKPTSSTEGQIIESSKTVLSIGVRPRHSGSAPSLSERVTTSKKQKLHDPFSRTHRRSFITENTDTSSTNFKQNLHDPSIPCVVHAPVAVHEALKRAREYLEKMKVPRKAKEVSITLVKKNLELEESVIALQARVRELENDKAKVSEREDHDQLVAGLKNLELEESASTIQTRVKELENELSKTSEDHE